MKGKERLLPADPRFKGATPEKLAKALRKPKVKKQRKGQRIA